MYFFIYRTAEAEQDGISRPDKWRYSQDFPTIEDALRDADEGLADGTYLQISDRVFDGERTEFVKRETER